MVLALSSQINWYVTWSLSSIHDLRGCDLTLTSGSTLTLTYTKQNVYHSTRRYERITMVLEFWACGHFWWSYEPKSKPQPLGHWPDLWGHRRTWDVKFWYQLLRFVTADTLIFRETLGQLGAKRWEGATTPYRPKVCRKPLSVTSDECYDSKGTWQYYKNCKNYKLTQVDGLRSNWWRHMYRWGQRSDIYRLGRCLLANVHIIHISLELQKNISLRCSERKSSGCICVTPQSSELRVLITWAPKTKNCLGRY